MVLTDVQMPLGTSGGPGKIPGKVLGFSWTERVGTLFMVAF